MKTTNGDIDSLAVDDDDVYDNIQYYYDVLMVFVCNDIDSWRICV